MTELKCLKFLYLSYLINLLIPFTCLKVHVLNNDKLNFFKCPIFTDNL